MNLQDYTIEDVVTEGLIFNKKDLAVNIHNWKPGEKNVLYVTGLSGSGKSTLARSYAEKYKAYSIELDRFMYTYQFIGQKHYDRKDEELINAYYKEYPITKTSKEMTYTEWRNFLFNCFKYLVKRMHADSKHLYVVEGIQLVPIAMGDPECGKEVFSSPILVKNTSLLTALWRRAHRDASSAGAIESMPMLFRMLNWYVGETRNLDRFAKLSKDSVVEFLGPNTMPTVATEGILQVITKKISESVSDEQVKAMEFKKENQAWHKGRALAWQYFLKKYHVNIDTCSDAQREKLKTILVKKIERDIGKGDPMEPNFIIDALNRKYRDMVDARIVNFYLDSDGDIGFDITL